MLLKLVSWLWAACLCLLFVCTAASPSSLNPRKLMLHNGDVNSAHSSVTNERFVREVSYDVGEERDNCSDIHNPPPQYNNSICELVRAECDGKYELFNYLNLVMCGLGESLQVSDTYNAESCKITMKSFYGNLCTYLFNV